MIVGSTKEDLSLEKRISITPETAKNIINLGLRIFIENDYATHLGIKDEEYKNTGSVKFWEVTVGKPVVPPMANRWEGRDDEMAYQIAIGKYKVKKKKKARTKIRKKKLK